MQSCRRSLLSQLRGFQGEKKKEGLEHCDQQVKGCLHFRWDVLLLDDILDICRFQLLVIIMIVLLKTCKMDGTRFASPNSSCIGWVWNKVVNLFVYNSPVLLQHHMLKHPSSAARPPPPVLRLTRHRCSEQWSISMLTECVCVLQERQSSSHFTFSDTCGWKLSTKRARGKRESATGRTKANRVH